MDTTTQIITQIEVQIDRLQKARLLLLGNTEISITNPAPADQTLDIFAQAAQEAPRRGRPPMNMASPGKPTKAKGITAEGRKRIAEAMRKRWAAQKEAVGKHKKSAAA